MKKFLIVLILALIAAAGVAAYWYTSIRMDSQGAGATLSLPDAAEAQAKPAAAPETETPPADESEPVSEVQPAPAVEPEAGDAPADLADEPTPEPTPEPEPAPLPALNAEAEALLPRAEAGDPVAQFNLARQYVLGEGMSVDREAFLRWCRTAAEQGLPEAQFALAMCYRQGLGVEQNEQEATLLLQQAADSGYAPAQEQLNP